jgi:hypothetical protein
LHAVLQKIFYPVIENGCWRWRKNSEMHNLYGKRDVVKFMKLGRLRLAGHVMRMDGSDPARKVLCTEPGGIGGRKRGRLNLRWCGDELEEDVERVGCRNCRLNAQ